MEYHHTSYHLTELFSEDIYIIKSENIKDTKSDIIKNEDNKLDENNSKIDAESLYENKLYIFTDYELTVTEKTFLTKILSAIKINLNEDCILKKVDNFPIDFKGKSFYFCSKSMSCKLNNYNITAPHLSKISESVELKKSLWEFMQKTF